jgi:repressor LexA
MLSDRQTAILKFIREFSGLSGYAPSVVEIEQAVGLRSTSAVRHQIKVLQLRGYLRRHPKRQPRSISLTDKALNVPNPCGRKRINRAEAA